MVGILSLLIFEDPVILQPSINLAFINARKKQGKRPYLKKGNVYKKHIFAMYQMQEKSIIIVEIKCKN